MTLSKAIGERIKQLLNERQFSQYELYKRGGVPRSTVCDVINNNKKRVSTDTVYQICSTLGISLQEFFDDPLFENLDDW